MAEVMASSPVQACIFFSGLFFTIPNPSSVIMVMLTITYKMIHASSETKTGVLHAKLGEGCIEFLLFIEKRQGNSHIFSKMAQSNLDHLHLNYPDVLNIRTFPLVLFIFMNINELLR